MQKYLENALHGCNVNVNFFISLIHYLLFSQHEEPIHSLLSQTSSLACLWKSMTRMENNLSSSNLYHIKVVENRMLWYVTSKRKNKQNQNSFVLTATWRTMEDLKVF